MFYTKKKICRSLLTITHFKIKQRQDMTRKNKEKEKTVSTNASIKAQKEICLKKKDPNKKPDE